MEQEEADDRRFEQARGMDPIRGVERKPVDPNVAAARYQKEIAPVLARRERAKNSRAYRLFLKATGQWKGMEAGDVEEVHPSKGLVMTGPSLEEVQKAIADNPAAFKDLIRSPVEVRPVEAKRKTAADLVRGHE